MDIDDDQLSATLSKLKERGSSLLVAGAVPDSKHLAVSRELLGDPAAGPRRQVLVLTDDHVADVGKRLPAATARTGPGAPTLIRVTNADRSASGATEGGAVLQPTQQIEAEDLESLATAIYETITAADEDEDLEPAELRLAFDSLTPLIHLHGDQMMFKVLHLLNHALRKRSAMGHFHLPLDPDTETVRLLSPLFDVMVELRRTNSHVQQRWHVHEGNLVTDWMDV